MQPSFNSGLHFVPYRFSPTATGSLPQLHSLMHTDCICTKTGHQPAAFSVVQSSTQPLRISHSTFCSCKTLVGKHCCTVTMFVLAGKQFTLYLQWSGGRIIIVLILNYCLVRNSLVRLQQKHRSLICTRSVAVLLWTTLEWFRFRLKYSHTVMQYLFTDALHIHLISNSV